MSDEKFQDLFSSADFGKPSDLDFANWKRLYRKSGPKRQSDWLRLAAACAVGFLVGIATIKGLDQSKSKNIQVVAENDATIESISVNLQ